MSTRVLVLAPGEKVYIPANAVVTSIVTEAGAVLVTDCVGLPEAEEYACYDFSFAVSDNFSGDAALGDDAGGPTLTSIIVGGITYTIDYDLAYVPDGGFPIVATAEATNLHDAIVAEIPQAIFDPINIFINPFEGRAEYTIRFKTLPSLIAGISLFMEGIGFANGLTLFPVSADCECIGITDDQGQFCDPDFLL